MRWTVAILLFATTTFGQAPSKPVNPVPQQFTSALAEAKIKSHLPILLPSELPQPIARAEYADIQSISEDAYSISLFYKKDAGNAGFAALFKADAPADDPKDIPNVRELKLAQGIHGYFREASCGGSCAPANLWWQEGHIVYQIQITLPSTSSYLVQKKTLISLANSAIAAGPR